MASPLDRPPVEFTEFHLFCGIGGGALGAASARATWLGCRGSIRTLGGIDFDPSACADFERFTGIPATCLDLFDRDQYVAFHGEQPPPEWREAMPEDIFRAAGGVCPDIVFSSPPCLPGHVPVLTLQGDRPIREVKAGTRVLTHRGRYRRVLKVGAHTYDGTIYGIRLNGTVDAQEFTAEHPLWRRRVVRPKANGKKRTLSGSEFVRADKVRVGDRIGFPVDPEEPGSARRFVDSFGDPRRINRGGKNDGARYAKPTHEAVSGRIVDLRPFAESPSLWFLVGAYLGDGYRRPSRHEIMYCVGPADGELAGNIRASLRELGLSFYEDHNGGSGNIKIRVTSRSLSLILGAFGDGSHRKDISPSLFGLERPLLEAMIGGYRSTDGSEQGRRLAGNVLQARWKIPSVSLPLLRSVQRLLLRLGTFASIHKCWPGGKQVIMGGRKVQTRPRWELNVRLDPEKRTVYEFKDGAVWVRVRSTERRQAQERVWNLEVEEDDTFCVPMMATHNCKGFSGLLPSASAGSEKYQALNRLTTQAVRLTLEAFKDDRPAVFLLENVPRIRTRGAELLEEIKRLLRGHGYHVTDSDHDCGEIGGLGQRRKRYLMIARNPKKLAPFIYQPPKRPLKTIGDVIGPLALPDDPSLGPMHRLPRLKWLTWLRLALIPAGGDWRDLQKITPEEYRIVRTEWGTTNNALTVQPWDKPAATITSSTRLSGSSPAAVADPRLKEKTGYNGSPGLYGVNGWDNPAKAITGGMRVPCSNTPAAIADPRLKENENRHFNIFRVQSMNEPSTTVTGTRFGSGAQAIADVRLGHDPRPGVYRILRMDETAQTVTGGAGVGTSNGPQAVADHRLGCKPRSGSYGVDGWGDTLSTVVGSGDVHAARCAIADPRIPGNDERPDPPPVIVALDGTWHRPLTTLELLALQSFPVRFADGTPVVLAGKADSRYRERIGNAVPPDASKGIHEQILLALLQNAVGETFVLGTTDIWVRREKREKEKWRNVTER
ncbi:MAG: DNA cytosine methyltransferase [Deltaproteobacteria bacterium]|nr:DNA cytosine methyltransferase [Deltaproteobacteria bacterium]